MLKEYIEKEKVQPETYIFKGRPAHINQYIRQLAYKILNIGEAETVIINGRKLEYINNGVSMYDFRHSSACYWLPRYKSESALKYRFGWKKSDMIHYYTEFLGMKDTISEDDLYLDVSKTELEKQINNKGREIELLNDQLQDQNKKMKEQDQKMQEIMDVLRALQLEKLVEQKTET
ncbi:MAG: hypothetical protein QXG00_04935 [Candidatus Woesearchaeota archaeon]